MASLIDLVKGHFTDDLVERLGPFLGVDGEKANKIADAVIPALLGAVTQRAGDGDILDLIKTFVGDGFDFGKIWNPAGGLVSLVEQGHPIVSTLFGDRAKESVAAVAKAAGTTDHEARKALNLTAPALLGTLASSLGGGVTTAGLAGLLEASKDSIADKAGSLGLPFDVKAGIAALAGLAGASAVAAAGTQDGEAPAPQVKKTPKRITVGDTDQVKEAVVASVAATPSVTPAPPAPVAEITPEEDHKIAAVTGQVPVVTSPAAKGSMFGVAAILGFGLIGTVLLMKGCDAVPAGVPPVTEETHSGAATPEVKVSEPKIEEPAMPPAPTDEASKTGDIKVELDGGVQLDAAANGIEYKLVEFIKSDKPVDKETWFSFDRLYFDTAKASLKPESQKQLQNIVEVMKAFPNVKLKIGGYTDNQGADDFNMKLSTERAKTTYEKLTTMGVAADRLAYEGYGKAHPVADNATEAGREKNRRIDVRVTAK
ncbi:MAG: OmpA family protein [Armatimonadota bacterium]